MNNKTCLLINTTECFTCLFRALRSGFRVQIGMLQLFLAAAMLLCGLGQQQYQGIAARGEFEKLSVSTLSNISACRLHWSVYNRPEVLIMVNNRLTLLGRLNRDNILTKLTLRLTATRDVIYGFWYGDQTLDQLAPCWFDHILDHKALFSDYQFIVKSFSTVLHYVHFCCFMAESWQK